MVGCGVAKGALAVLLAFVWNGSLTAVEGSVLHFNEPDLLFSATLPTVGEGNAVVVSPDGQVVYATSLDGTLSGFDPLTGDLLFSYKPSQLGGSNMVCRSGVSFFKGIADTQSYVVYVVSDETNSLEGTSRVVALSHPSGAELWISQNLDGIATGTPMISASGEHVFINHNTDKISSGVFTVLHAKQGGSQLFSSRNTTNPFAPLGIFHSPAEGHYTGGESNSNDILVWAFASRPNASSVSSSGGSFAFQFPAFYQGDSAGLGVAVLNNGASWTSATAPVLANNGYTLYFGISRNQLRAWIGEKGVNRRKFDRPAAYEQNSLGRGRPGYLPTPSSPTLNSDASMVFCALANKNVAGFDPKLDVAWIVPVEERGAEFSTKVVVSVDDKLVYFAESSGLLHAALASDGRKIWKQKLAGNVISEFDLSPDGTTLYVADTTGTISAWLVAEPTPPCLLCEDGSPPLFPDAKLTIPGLTAGNCSQVEQMGIDRRIDTANCFIIQLLAKDTCGCGPATPNTSTPVPVATAAPVVSPPTASPTPSPSAVASKPKPGNASSTAVPTTPTDPGDSSGSTRLAVSNFGVLAALASAVLMGCM